MKLNYYKMTEQNLRIQYVTHANVIYYVICKAMHMNSIPQHM